MSGYGIILAVLLSLPSLLYADSRVQLDVQHKGPNLEFRWTAAALRPDGKLDFPFFELQGSYDLKNWTSISDRMQAPVLDTNTALTATVALDSKYRFYRVLGQFAGFRALGTNGADIFGYEEAFTNKLSQIGQIPAAALNELYPSGPYLPGLSWDPTLAKYWDLFTIDPIAWNAGLPPNSPDRKFYDFRLSAPELAVFKQNGFVVSERLGRTSFGELYYRLWKQDLPVFISTDALLQAWHRTYDEILQEVEETFLFSAVQSLLDGMAAKLPDIWQASTDHQSALDADYFIGVARALLNHSAPTSIAGQEATIQQTLNLITNLALATTSVFGDCRVVDFGQFKIRGHYERTPRLGQYFQCLIWLGRMDMRVAGGPFDDGCGPHMASSRQLGLAIALWDLLNRSGKFDLWQRIDQTIQSFAGWSDSMNFAQLNGLLQAAGVKSLADLNVTGKLSDLQQSIENGSLGVQNIRSDFFVSPLGPDQIILPRSFTFLGQRFVFDSWALSKVIFDDILWNGEKIDRRQPSALDVAFAVLGNNEIVPELIGQITNSLAAKSTNHLVHFRDGFSYQHNLAAVREVIDSQQDSVWSGNIYSGWLNLLRALSQPTTRSSYPEAMRTKNWALKNVNAQMASWTQLRHDNILYAKPSSTPGLACDYPAGYVEPKIEFFSRLTTLALHLAQSLASLPYTTLNVPSPYDLGQVQSNQVAHLQNFADVAARLNVMAQKELNQLPFDSAETLFAQSHSAAQPL